jgi:two-component system sensor histidine kinase RegB
MEPLYTRTSGKTHLGHLVIIRSLVIVCLLIGGILNSWLLENQLPLIPLASILCLFTLINLLTWGRLRKELPVTDVEIFIQLLIDVACLAVVFYFSGGANNPFVSYFLVPVCLAATTLPWIYVWSISLLCIITYTLLLFFHIPLPLLSPHQHHASSINLHVLGMWLNFFISAVLITFFVVRIARDLRQREEQLNGHREDQLRDEQLMAVATLAAGTAHELGTPLATMKVIVSELRREVDSGTQTAQDLALLSDQIDICAHTLKQLHQQAEENQSGQFIPQSVSSFCQQVIERWQIMHPEVTAQICIEEQCPDIHQIFHPTINQALINVLNNAADAHPQNIRIHVSWDDRQLHWQIEDEGPGIPLDLVDQLGKAFITTKGHGLGLGLFLTQATLNRHGGYVRLYNRKPVGTLTEVMIPLSSSPALGGNR